MTLTKVLPEILKKLVQSKLTSLLLLLITLSFTVASLFYMRTIKTHYSLKQFQPKDHKDLLLTNDIDNKYLLAEANPYIVSLSLPKGQSWLSEAHLNQIQQLTEELTESEYILDMNSIENIDVAVVDEDSFKLGNAREIADTNSLLKDPLLTPGLITSSGQHTSLIIRPDILTSKEHGHLFASIQNLLRKLPNNIKSHIGGPASVTIQMKQLLASEILLFILASLFLSTLFLALIFKGWAAPLISLSLTLVANSISIAMIAYFGIPLTVLSNTVPILITITIIAITCHSLVTLEHTNKKNKIDSIGQMLSELAAPHFLTALTTAIGFATLIPSEVPVISQFGLSVSASVLIACSVSLLLLPFCLFYLPPVQRRIWNLPKIDTGAYLFKYRKLIVVTVTLVCVSFLALFPRLNWSTQVLDDLPKSHAARQANQFIDDHLGGTLLLHVTIGKEGTKDLWKSSPEIKKLAHFTDSLRTIKGIGSVQSYTDFLKMASPEKSLPKNKKSLAETLLVYGMADDNPLDHHLTPNLSETRVSIRTQDIPSHELDAVILAVNTYANDLFPNLDVSVVGPAVSVHQINRSISWQLIRGFFEALLLIFLLLAIVFRSLSWALLSVVPNLVPPAFLIGAMALSQTPIKPGIAIIFAISLGIAFDNTVYILSRLKKEMKAGADLSRETILRITQEESKACALSSLCLLTGFSVFVFSYFSVNILFGVFMMVSILAGLIGDLVLLPALLTTVPGLLRFNHDRVILYKLQEKIMQPKFIKATTGLFLLIALVFGFSKANAADKMTAKAILKRVQKNNIVPNERAEIKMVIKDRDGSKKEREIIVIKKNGSEKKALVKLLKPADLRGVGLLSVSKGSNDESQWLYLPSEKRSRRLASSGKSGKFLDSDLSYEDLSISTYRNFNNKVEKLLKDKNIAVILSKVKNKDNSSYKKIRTWVDLKTYQIKKANYYNHKNKLVKKMSFRKYKKHGKVWRAHHVVVKNIPKKRSTSLRVKKISLKKVSDSEISMSALEDV